MKKYKRGDILCGGLKGTSWFLVTDVSYGKSNYEDETGYLSLAPLFERYKENEKEIPFIFVESPSAGDRLQNIPREIVSIKVRQEIQFIEKAIRKHEFEHLNAKLSDYVK